MLQFLLILTLQPGLLLKKGPLSYPALTSPSYPLSLASTSELLLLTLGPFAQVILQAHWFPDPFCLQHVNMEAHVKSQVGRSGQRWGGKGQDGLFGGSTDPFRTKVSCRLK